MILGRAISWATFGGVAISCSVCFAQHKISSCQSYTVIIPIDGDATELHSYEIAGSFSFGRGEYEKAISNCSEAIRIDPQRSIDYNNRGAARAQIGDLDSGIRDFSYALQITPGNSTEFEHGDNWCALTVKDDSKRIEELSDKDALEYLPQSALVHRNRGMAWAMKGNYQMAFQDLDESIRLNPRNSTMYHVRATVDVMKDDFASAIRDYSESVRLDPTDVAVNDQLAWLRATCAEASFRDGKQAVELATKACELGKGEPGCCDTLAAAYAESGDFDAAAKWELVYLGQCVAGDRTTAAAENRLSLYRQMKPYREYQLRPDLQKRLFVPTIASTSVSND